MEKVPSPAGGGSPRSVLMRYRQFTSKLRDSLGLVTQSSSKWGLPSFETVHRGPLTEVPRTQPLLKPGSVQGKL